MKYSYFTLAAVATVQAAPQYSDVDYMDESFGPSVSPLEAALMEALENVVAQVYQETDNGFIINVEPYYRLENTYTQNSFTSVSKWSADGVNYDNQNISMTWDDVSISGTASANGFFANNEMWAFTNPQAWELFTTYDKTLEFSMSCDGVSNAKFDWSQVSSVDNQKATNDAQGSLNVDFSLEGDNGQVVINASKKITNTGFPADFDLGMWADCDNYLSATSSTNVAACATFFEAPFSVADPNNKCVISNVYAFSNKVANENCDGDLSLEFSGKFIAAILTNSNGVQGVVIRGEDADNQGELIANGNFYGLYYVQSAAYRQAVALGQGALVLRVPGLNTIENVLIPLLYEKVKVWEQFFGSLFENYEDIPLVIYYGNEILAELDDELDFSGIVAASRIGSDLLGLPNQGLTMAVQAAGAELSSDIQNCPDVAAFYEELHSGVNYLINDSQADYEQAFGSIF